MRAAREDARTQAEGDRRHVTKSEQSPNRLEQNQNALKLELKPVKRYEHLTGSDAYTTRKQAVATKATHGPGALQPRATHAPPGRPRLDAPQLALARCDLRLDQRTLRRLGISHC